MLHVTVCTYNERQIDSESQCHRGNQRGKGPRREGAIGRCGTIRYESHVRERELSSASRTLLYYCFVLYCTSRLYYTLILNARRVDGELYVRSKGRVKTNKNKAKTAEIGVLYHSIFCLHVFYRFYIYLHSYKYASIYTPSEYNLYNIIHRLLLTADYYTYFA